MPETAFKNRLWQSSDQFIMNRADFKKDFPGYAYAYEDVISSWPRIKKVISQDIKVDQNKPGTVDLVPLSKQPPGICTRW